MIALLAYWRIAAGAAVVALILWAGWLVMSWRDDSHHLAAVTAQLAAERASHAREIALAAKASKDYHDELDSIRTARQPVPVVRLCRAAPAVPASTPGRTDDSPAASGVGLSGSQGGDQPGPDIGSDLDQIAARCDAVTAQLRALQGWELSVGDNSD